MERFHRRDRIYPGQGRHERIYTTTLVGNTTTRSYMDTGLVNGAPYYYAVSPQASGRQRIFHTGHRDSFAAIRHIGLAR